MTRTAKNYNEAGGDVTVIDGELQITSNGVVRVNGSVVEFTGGVINAYTKAEADSLLAAKLTATKSANQAATVAADLAALKVDFNALLTKLKAAGIMTADS